MSIKQIPISPKGVNDPGLGFCGQSSWEEVPVGIKKLTKSMSYSKKQEFYESLHAKSNISPSRRTVSPTRTCFWTPPVDDFHLSRSPSSPLRLETFSMSGLEDRQLSSAPSPHFLKSGAFRRRANPPNTELRRHYDDSHLPLQLWHGGVLNQLRWTTPPAQCNLQRLLPVFIDGLRELEEPYKFVALQGSLDLINGGQTKRVLVVIDFIIPRMQSCLNTRIVPVISRVLLVLRMLLKAHPSVGPLLIPHYRKLYPIMSSFLRNPSHNIGTEVLETLELMEQCGGPKAFREIKDYIPTYQSVLAL